MHRVAPLLAFALLGCVAQAAPTHPLAGSEWRFISIDGQRPVSDKTALGFAENGLSGTVGCNRMAGPWRVEEGRLIAGPLAQTRMFCAGAVGQQEQAIGALLVSAPELTLEGDRLVLQSRGHSAELERAKAE